MRQTIAILMVGAALAATFTGGAAADPSARCAGEITAGIASTWPWAHEGHEFFAPPKGGIAKWVDEFGPLVGISSVRELQQLFCAGGL